MIILKVLAALVIGLLAILLMLNWFRPDLFRFESVAVTRRPAVLDALNTRLVALRQLSDAELRSLPEAQHERTRVDNREVVYHTTRTTLANGDVQFLICAAVKETPGLLARPVGVAVEGFRMSPNSLRAPLTEEESHVLAADCDTDPLYD